MARRQKEEDAGTATQPTDEDSDAEQTIRLNPPPQQGPADEMELKKMPIRTADAGYPEIIAGKSSRCCKTHHLKYCLIGLNFVLAMLGFLIAALAIWIRADPDFWQYNNSLDIGDFYKACYMFMIAGLIIIFVAFLGCCGAVNEVQWMLITYIVVFFIFLIVEFVALVVVWHAPYNTTIQNAMSQTLKKKLEDRGNDDSVRKFMDYIQAHLECCGSYNFMDYSFDAPNSCNDLQTGNVHTEGCTTAILRYLKTKAGIIGGIALPVVLFHVFAIIASVCLLKDIKQQSRYGL